MVSLTYFNEINLLSPKEVREFTANAGFELQQRWDVVGCSADVVPRAHVFYSAAHVLYSAAHVLYSAAHVLYRKVF